MRRPSPLRTALALAPLLLACDRLPGRPDPADRYRRPTEILDFATLYGTHCSGCHGAKGRLGAARPLADPVYLALVDEALLRTRISDGVPRTAMPAFAVERGGTLVEAQVGVIAQGILARWADPAAVSGVSVPPYHAPAATTAGDPPDEADRGGVAFARFCADCHGAEGQGSPKGGSVVDPDLLALVSDQWLRTTVIAGRPDLGMPDWRKLSDRAMTPQEISDVVAWLVARRPAHRDPALGGPDGGS